MPAYRSNMRCTYTDSSAKKSRDREHKKQPTPEEKAAAKTKRSATEVLQEKQEEWTARLRPWTGDERMRWPLGTLALSKSDAKNAFKLTEAELLTLAHESIPNSGRSHSYYALRRQSSCTPEIPRGRGACRFVDGPQCARERGPSEEAHGQRAEE
ncbi:hypothetical protein C8R45DRAFT_983850 [Mycena sanguinolenta]|nr:hypothetical protein C8R45DRAFT_983850 [Mycena sanguinolenta]